jgi:hemerythrin-like domain-containing protein
MNIRVKLALPLGQKALMILDFFSAQLGEDFRQLMLSKNLVFVYVPTNCTSKLQPMDLSVQKCVKDRMRNSFEDYYAELVAKVSKQKRNSMSIWE